MTNPEEIKHILLSEIEKMNRHREDFCKCPGIFYPYECKGRIFKWFSVRRGRCRSDIDRL